MPAERSEIDLGVNDVEGLSPVDLPQAQEQLPTTPGETPVDLQKKVQEDLARNEKAPEILRRIEALVDYSMPIPWLTKAHPELSGLHLRDRFHVTKDNQLIFFNEDKAYLLPSVVAFETGEGNIFQTTEEKQLFEGSITRVLQSNGYLDSNPLIQNLAIYRFLNPNDPNRETAVKNALEQSEQYMDGLVKTLKPEAPAPVSTEAEVGQSTQPQEVPKAA